MGFCTVNRIEPCRARFKPAATGGQAGVGWAGFICPRGSHRVDTLRFEYPTRPRSAEASRRRPEACTIVQPKGSHPVETIARIASMARIARMMTRGSTQTKKARHRRAFFAGYDPQPISFSTIKSAACSAVSRVVSMRISGDSGASYGESMPVKFFSSPARAFL